MDGRSCEQCEKRERLTVVIANEMGVPAKRGTGMACFSVVGLWLGEVEGFGQRDAGWEDPIHSPGL